MEQTIIQCDTCGSQIYFESGRIKKEFHTPLSVEQFKVGDATYFIDNCHYCSVECLSVKLASYVKSKPLDIDILINLAQKCGYSLVKKENQRVHDEVLAEFK